MERFNQRRVKPEFDALKQRIGLWTSSQRLTLESYEPEMPEGLNDRMQEALMPLVSLADLCGHGIRARAALVRLVQHEERENMSDGVRAIQAMVHEFGRFPNVSELSTEFLITSMTADSSGHWAEFRNGKALTARQLALLVEPHGLRPRRSTSSSPRAYGRKEVLDAWERYKPRSLKTEPVEPADATEPRQAREAGQGLPGLGPRKPIKYPPKRRKHDAEESP